MRMLARPRSGRSLAVLLLLLLSDGCSGKSSGKKRRKPGSKPSAAAVAAAETTTCAHCLAIQETIGRAIAQNISGIRRRAVHATPPLRHPLRHPHHRRRPHCPRRHRHLRHPRHLPRHHPAHRHRRRAVHATLPIHDIVQDLCDTEAWAAERYQPELEQACVRATRPGWFELFEHWSAPGLAPTLTLTLPSPSPSPSLNPKP